MEQKYNAENKGNVYSKNTQQKCKATAPSKNTKQDFKYNIRQSTKQAIQSNCNANIVKGKRNECKAKPKGKESNDTKQNTK